MAQGKMFFVGSKKGKRKRKSKKPAAKVRDIVRREISKQFEEKHYQDTGTVSLSTTPDIQYLTLVPQATTASTDETRDGDEIKPLGFELRATVTTSSADTNGGLVRIILFRWKEDSSEASGPVIASDILHDTDVQDNVVSPFNHDQRKDYDILYDTVVNLGIISAERKYHYVKMFVPASKLPKIYFNAGSVIGKNHIVMMSMCTQPSNTPSLLYYSRLRFRD